MRRKPTDDYISRQAAIDAAREDGKKIPTVAIRIMHDIKAIPAADVVPVVRCRECKHCIASRQGNVFCIRGFEQTIISAFAAIDNPVFERELDSFCSYGERKEEDVSRFYTTDGDPEPGKSK